MKETAGQEILLTIIYLNIILVILLQLWVIGEGPTIGLSYSPRKIAREKRLSFRGHGDCILLY